MELDSLLGSIGGSKQIQTGRDPKYSYSQLRQRLLVGLRRGSERVVRSDNSGSAALGANVAVITNRSTKAQMETERQKKLMAQAGRLLARRAHSRAELGERLARLAEPGEVDQVLDHLVELRLLNDANYAYNLSLHRLTREGWGPLRVRRELIERRVEPATADEALARVLDETGEETILKRYLVRYAGRRGWPGEIADHSQH